MEDKGKIPLKLSLNVKYMKVSVIVAREETERRGEENEGRDEGRDIFIERNRRRV